MAAGDEKTVPKAKPSWIWLWITLFGLGIMALTWADLAQPGNDKPSELSP